MKNLIFLVGCDKKVRFVKEGNFIDALIFFNEKVPFTINDNGDALSRFGNIIISKEDLENNVNSNWSYHDHDNDSNNIYAYYTKSINELTKEEITAYLSKSHYSSDIKEVLELNGYSYEAYMVNLTFYNYEDLVTTNLQWEEMLGKVYTNLGRTYNVEKDTLNCVKCVNDNFYCLTSVLNHVI